MFSEKIAKIFNFQDITKSQPKVRREVILVIEHIKTKKWSLIQGYLLGFKDKLVFDVKLHSKEGRDACVSRALTVDPSVPDWDFGACVTSNNDWRVVGWTPILSVDEMDGN